jgi:shikimate kinase
MVGADSGGSRSLGAVVRPVVKLRVMVNIYLVGFMGAGKTSLGQRLAKQLGARFLDLDERLSERFGCPLSEVFEHHGEAVFRAAEAEELARVSGEDGLVVATGGGAFSSRANREVIEGSGGISVFLDLPWEELERRLAADNAGRPAYRDPEQARRLYDERLPHYRRATLTIPLRGSEPQEEIVETIVGAVRGVPCGI